MLPYLNGKSNLEMISSRNIKKNKVEEAAYEAYAQLQQMINYQFGANFTRFALCLLMYFPNYDVLLHIFIIINMLIPILCKK